MKRTHTHQGQGYFVPTCNCDDPSAPHPTYGEGSDFRDRIGFTLFIVLLIVTAIAIALILSANS